MAFAIYLHRENFVPESPLIVDKNVSDANVNFTFVDFVPGVIKRSNTVIPQCEVEYHSFRFVLPSREHIFFLQGLSHHFSPLLLLLFQLCVSISCKMETFLAV